MSAIGIGVAAEGFSPGPSDLASVGAAPGVLLTAEEFASLPDDGMHYELQRGRVVAVNMPFPRHGEICANVVSLLRPYVKANELGRVVSNDSGVVTERGPDSVRGADVAFYSFALVPRGPLPQGYLPTAPELIFEVRSPGDRWPGILLKVGEYLNAGVQVVCVLDQQPQTLHLYTSEDPVRILGADQEFTLPAILGGFRCQVGAFFE